MVIRMRHNRSQKRQRRGNNIKASVPTLVVDKDTGVTHQRHRVCLKTGRYNGKVVFDNVSKEVKADK